MKQNSPAWWLRLLLAFGAIAVFWITGFTQSEPCGPIDKVSLYCLLHPASAAAKAGIVLFNISAFIISGIWSLFIDEDKLTWGNSWLIHLILLVGIAGGLLLIYS